LKTICLIFLIALVYGCVQHRISPSEENLSDKLQERTSKLSHELAAEKINRVKLLVLMCRNDSLAERYKDSCLAALIMLSPSHLKRLDTNVIKTPAADKIIDNYLSFISDSATNVAENILLGKDVGL